jgi:hypothetical protein
MKRLTKRLLNEINHEAELLAPNYLRSDHTKISRITGPNYTYFTNGHLIKVFFEGVGLNYTSKYLSGFIFPIQSYLELVLLKNILKDLKAIKTLNETL